MCEITGGVLLYTANFVTNFQVDSNIFDRRSGNGYWIMGEPSIDEDHGTIPVTVFPEKVRRFVVYV